MIIPMKGCETWFRLYEEFNESPESLEARWRIAMHWAAQERFDKAETILNEAQGLLKKYFEKLSSQQQKTDTILSLFHPPADSVITLFKLTELQARIDKLLTSIGPENRKGGSGAEKRLGKFLRLDPHGIQFPQQLEQLRTEMSVDDPLRDNVLLAAG